jgi:hypothetical protein
MANFPDHLRGDTWFGFVLSASDVTTPETPVAYSFTGARILFQMRDGNSRGAPLVLELSTDAGGGLTITDAGASVTAAARVVDVPPKTYYTEIQVTSAAGVVLTFNQGTWVITEDVANE